MAVAVLTERVARRVRLVPKGSDAGADEVRAALAGYRDGPGPAFPPDREHVSRTFRAPSS